MEHTAARLVRLDQQQIRRLSLPEQHQCPWKGGTGACCEDMYVTTIIARHDPPDQ